MIMEDRNASGSRNVGVMLLILFLIGAAVVLFLPAIPDTAKLLLLGTVLIVGGIWGRRRMGQG
jgi:hypothetical protein